jgi:hypothetical protein
VRLPGEPHEQDLEHGKSSSRRTYVGQDPIHDRFVEVDPGVLRRGKDYLSKLGPRKRCEKDRRVFQPPGEKGRFEESRNRVRTKS